MLQVRELNTLEELGQYRDSWSSLLAETASATWFQSLEWLEVYWRHYGAGQRLRVLVVLDGDAPIGILPLVVRSEDTRVGPMRLLTYPLHDWGTFFAPVGASPTATLLAGLNHVRSTRRDWDLLDLRWVDRDGSDRGRTRQALQAAGYEPHEQVWVQSAQMDLSPGWEAYWSSRKSHWRTNVRRCEKKLAQRGEVSYVRYRPRGLAQSDCDPRWDLYDACERLARSSWQGSSSTGTTLSHEEVRLFFRDAHARASENGTLDMNLLLLDGVPAAFAYNYHYRGRVTGLRMGFDSTVCRDGTGTVLQYRALQDSCQRGDHDYDLGPMYLACKRHWQTCLRSSYRYAYYPPFAARPRVLRLKRWMDSRLGSQHEVSPAGLAS